MFNYIYIVINLLAICLLLGSIFLMLLKIRDSIFIYIPFIVTREKAIELIIRELQLKNNSVLYDLGCGDGRILTRAIRNTPGARGIGMEKGIIPYLLACMRTRKLPIKIMYKDLFSTDLSGATHIYCYLHHTVMGKVEEKIIDECKKGTRIVVNDYPFTALIAQENIFTQEDGSPLSSKIYTYTL